MTSSFTSVRVVRWERVSAVPPVVQFHGVTDGPEPEVLSTRVGLTDPRCSRLNDAFETGEAVTEDAFFGEEGAR